MLYDKERWEPKPVVVLEPWRQALLDAANIIRERGWCQRTVETKDGRVCIMGAFRHLHGHIPHNILDVAKDTFASHLGMPIALWNDKRTTTKELVLQTLEAVARK